MATILRVLQVTEEPAAGLAEDLLQELKLQLQEGEEVDDEDTARPAASPAGLYH